MLRTLRTALGLCVGAMGVSAAGSPESARAATGVWPSDSPESVRMQGIKARFGNVSPHAGPGPAGFFAAVLGGGPVLDAVGKSDKRGQSVRFDGRGRVRGHAVPRVKRVRGRVGGGLLV